MLSATRKRVTPPAVIATIGQAVVWVQRTRRRAFRRTLVDAVLPVASALLAAGLLASPARAESCPNEALRVGPSANLPDCRAYEQATPVDKNGGGVLGAVNLVQASVSGNRVTFKAPSGLPTTGGSSSLVIYVASRGGDSWSTNGSLPASEPNEGPEIMGWDPELSTFASYANSFAAYLHDPATAGRLYLGDTATRSFRLSNETPVLEPQPYAAGFAANPHHFLIESSVELAPGGREFKRDVYDFDEGDLTLVGRVPPGTATACDDESGGPGPACEATNEGTFAGPYNWAQSDTTAGGARGSGSLHYYTANAISQDGSKVFFTTAGSGQLYMREDGTRTVQVSAAAQGAPTDPNAPKPAAFVAATASGSRVYFLSCQKLTENSTAVSTPGATCGGVEQGQDLYSYDTTSGALTDLTVDHEPTASDPTAASVQGVLGASEDGSDVYFVANGVLSGDQQNAIGERAEPGSCNTSEPELGGDCNLYLSHLGERPIFIARLHAPTFSSDFLDWVPYYQATLAGNNVSPESRVAADGTLLFSSVKSLTGYNNEPGSGSCGESPGCREYYRYQPSTDQLTCLSCDPSGGPPSASADLETQQPGLSGSVFSYFVTRNISRDGNRIFFNSPDSLVPADTNGVTDPYEWEAVGSGSCRSATTEGGCLYLLSSGRSPLPSFLADVSATGDDAFIFTAQSLVPADNDETVDIYDARVDGGIASQYPPAAGAPCLGEACRGPLAAASSGLSAGTETFAGPGNLTPSAPAVPAVKSRSKPLTRAQKLAKALRLCHKDKRKKKRSACEKSAHKTFGRRK